MQINRKKALTIGAIFAVAVLIIVGGFFLGRYLAGPKTLAKVGDQKITEDDLAMEFVFSNKKPSDQEKLTALKQLVNCKIAQNEAGKLNLKVSDAEVNQSIKNVIGPDFSKYTDLQKNVVRDDTRCRILEYKVRDYYIAWADGNYLAINVPADDVVADSQAEVLADQLATDITNGKIKFDQAKNQVESNPSLNTTVSSFDKNAFLNNYDIFSDAAVKTSVFDYLKVAPSGDKTTSKSSLLALLVGQASAEGETAPIFALPAIVQRQAVKTGDSKIASRYLVIDVNNKQKGEYSSYDDFLKAKYKEYNVSYKINSKLNSKKDNNNVALSTGGVKDLTQNQFVTGVYYIDQKGNKVPLDLTANGKTNLELSVNNNQSNFQKTTTDKYTDSSNKTGQTQILLPEKISSTVASNLPQNISNVSGYWRWDVREHVTANDENSTTLGSNKIYNLGNISDTGKTYYNEFVWVSSYVIPAPANLISPPNGSLLAANRVVVKAEVQTTSLNSYKIKVRYKPINDSKWLETGWHPGEFIISGTPQEFDLNNLKTATKYEWQAKSLSVDGAESDWSTSSSFATARGKEDSADNVLIATATSENIDNAGDITFNGVIQNADYYVWNFGDGSTSEDLTETAFTHHVYENGGQIMATLTAYQYASQGSWYNKQTQYAGSVVLAQKEVEFFVNLPIIDTTTPTIEDEAIHGESDEILSNNKSLPSIDEIASKPLFGINVAEAAEKNVITSCELSKDLKLSASFKKETTTKDSRGVATTKYTDIAANQIKKGMKIEATVKATRSKNISLSCGNLKYSINWGVNDTSDNKSLVGARYQCNGYANYFYHTYTTDPAGKKITVTAHYYSEGENDNYDCVKQVSFSIPTVNTGSTSPVSPVSGTTCSLANAFQNNVKVDGKAVKVINPVDMTEDQKLTFNSIRRENNRNLDINATVWKADYGDGTVSGYKTDKNPDFSHKYTKKGSYTVKVYAYKGAVADKTLIACESSPYMFKVKVTAAETATVSKYGCNTATSQCGKSANGSYDTLVACEKECKATSSGSGGSSGGGSGGTSGGSGGGSSGSSCDNSVYAVREKKCVFVNNACSSSLDQCQCGIASLKIAQDLANPKKYNFTINLLVNSTAKIFRVDFGDGNINTYTTNTFSHTYGSTATYKVKVESFPSKESINSGEKACGVQNTTVSVRTCTTGTFTADTYSGDATAAPIKVTFSNSGASNVANYKLTYGANNLIKESPIFTSINTYDYPTGSYRPALEGFDSEGSSCGIVSLDKQMRFTGPGINNSGCKIGNLTAVPTEGEATSSKPLPVKFTSTGNEGATYFRLKWGDGSLAGETSGTQADLSFDHSYKRPNWGSPDGSYTAILQGYKNDPANGALMDCGSVSTVVKITNFEDPGDAKCSFTGTMTAKPKKGDAALEVSFDPNIKKASGATVEPNRWHVSYGDDRYNPGKGSTTFDATMAQLNKKNLKHTYNYTDDYSVVLSGTYNGLSCGSIATNVQVTGDKTPPVEKCTIGSLTVSPTEGKVSDKFTFNVTGMNNSRTVFIDYGDETEGETKTGNTETTLSLTHTYTAPSPTEGYKFTITGAMGQGSSLTPCGSQTVYVKVTGDPVAGQFLCSDSNQCIFGGATCPTGLDCYNNDNSCSGQCACVAEGEDLGPVTATNTKKCCTGLVETPPENGSVGNRGTCEQNDTGNTSQCEDNGQITCSNGSCADTEDECKAPEDCSATDQVTCGDGSCAETAADCSTETDPGLDGITLSADPLTGANPLITNFVISDKDGNEIEAPDTDYNIEIVQVGFESDPQTESYDGLPYKFCGPEQKTTYKAKATRTVTDSAGGEVNIVSNEVAITVNPSTNKDGCVVSDSGKSSYSELDSAEADAKQPSIALEQSDVDLLNKIYAEVEVSMNENTEMSKLSLIPKAFARPVTNGDLMIGYANKEKPSTNNINPACETIANNQGPRLKVFQDYGNKENDNHRKSDPNGACKNNAWCAAFVTYVHDKIAKLPGKLQSCYIPYMIDHAESQGKFKQITATQKPKKGDIIINNKKTHTGIFVEINTNGKYLSIEGNKGDPLTCVRDVKREQSYWGYFISV